MFKFKKDAVLFLIGVFLLGFGLSGFRLLFNLYLKEIGFLEGKIGFLLAIMTYATTVMIFPAAFIVRKIKIKPIFIISIIFSSFGSLIAIITPIYFQVAFGLIIAGIFCSFFSVISGPLMMQISTEVERAHLFSLNFAISLASGILGNILAGNLPIIFLNKGISLISGFRFALIIHILISLISLIPFILIKEEKIVDEKNLKIFDVKTSKILILKLSIPHILVGFGAGLTIPFLNLYFRDRFLLDSRGIGYLFSISQFMMIIGTLSAPFFAKIFGKIKTVIISQMLSVPFLFILSITYNFPLAAISFLLRATLMNMAQPLVMNFSLEIVNENDRPLVSGILNVAWLSAWGISANLSGKIIETQGYFIPFNLTLLFYVISSFLYFFFILPLEKDKNKY
ncbi:MAG: MFS transporter [Candidatus Hydrothermales bacterium]